MIDYLLMAACVGILIYAGIMLMRSRSQKNDVLAVIRMVEREEAKKRGKAASWPIPLTNPFMEADWKRLEGLRRDDRYRRAFSALKGRYAVVSNPMLLPNALRETMETRRVDLAEAVVILADAPQDHRVG